MFERRATLDHELLRLAREAALHLESRQRRIDLLLQNHQRASLNGTTGMLTLHARKLPLLSTRVVMVGHYEKASRTFRWAWGDPDSPPSLVAPLEDVQAVGEARGFPELTEAKWQGTLEEAAAMADITALVLDGRGTHRVEVDGVYTWYILLDPIAFESLPPAAGGEW